MSSMETSQVRTGSSKRKPLIIHKVPVSSITTDESDASSTEVDSIQQRMEVEEELKSGDEEGPPDLPEGTVVVKPEPVSESKLVFRGPEFTKKKSDSSCLVRLTCTSCGRQINPAKRNSTKKHPKLKVLMCKKCYKYYCSGEITRDADGLDEQCRWCGEGGRLLGCDFCHNAFCKGCILRNLGRAELSNIANSDNSKWKCYICKPSSIAFLTEQYDAVFQQIKSPPQETSKKGKLDPLPTKPACKAADVISISEEELSSIKPGTINGVIDRLLAATESVSLLLKSLKSQLKNQEAISGDDTPPLADDDLDQELYVSKLKKGMKNYFKVLKDSLVVDGYQKGFESKATCSVVKMEKENTSVGDELNPPSGWDTSTAESGVGCPRTIQTNRTRSSLAMMKSENKSFLKNQNKRNCGSKGSLVEKCIDIDEECSDDEQGSLVDEKTELVREDCMQEDSITQDYSSFVKLTGSKVEDEMECKPELSSEDEEKSEKVVTKKLREKSKSFSGKDASRKSRKLFLREDRNLRKFSREDGCGKSKLLSEDDDGSRKSKLLSDDDDESRKSKLLSEEDDGSRKSKLLSAEDGGSRKSKLLSAEDGGSRKSKLLSAEDGGSRKSKMLSAEDGGRRKSKMLSAEDGGRRKSKMLSAEDGGRRKSKSLSEDDDGSRNSKSLSEDDDGSRNSKKSTLEDDESSEKQKKSLLGDGSEKSGKTTIEKDDNVRSRKMSSEEYDNGRLGKSSLVENNGRSRGSVKSLITKENTRKKVNEEYDEKNSESNIDKQKSMSKKSEGKSSNGLKRREQVSDIDSDNSASLENSDSFNEDRLPVRSKKINGKKIVTAESPSLLNCTSLLESKSQVDKCDNVARSPSSENTAAQLALLMEMANEICKDQDLVEKEADIDDSNKEVGDNQSDHEQNVDGIFVDGKPQLSVADHTHKRNEEPPSGVNIKGESKISETEFDLEDEDATIICESTKDDCSSDDETSSEDSDIYDAGKRRKQHRKSKDKSKTVSKSKGKSESNKRKSKTSKDKTETQTPEDAKTASLSACSGKKRESKPRKKAAKLPDESMVPKKVRAEHNSDSSNYNSELEEEINKLSKKVVIKIPKKKGTSESEDAAEDENTELEEEEKNAEKEKSKNKKEIKSKELLFSDSSDKSGEESSEEAKSSTEEVDEEKCQAEARMSENVQAKAAMLEELNSDENGTEEEEEEDDSDSDSSSSGEVAKSSKKRKRKPQSDTKDEWDGSESDYVTTKKGRHDNRLLRAKLSDSDNSDYVKKRKKCKVSSNDDSDSSTSSYNSDEKKLGKRNRRNKLRADREGSEDSKSRSYQKKKGKRRRRIKKVKDSSDNSEESGITDSDDDKTSPGGAGKRKKIRKLISDKKLTDKTRAAAKAEEERRKRVSGRQKQFNMVINQESTIASKCPVTKSLVVQFDKKTKEPILEVDRNLVEKLKPHQVDAIHFMWDCCCETVEQLQTEEGGGCILAHCMGLGKTLSLISFVHMLLISTKITKMKTCLVVCPLNTVLNWKDEWEKWDEEQSITVYELTSVKLNWSRADMLKDWHNQGGIMLMGYEMYRNLCLGNHTKNKRQRKIFQETLVDPGPDMVVCDEGHVLRNDSSAISKAMKKIRTKRRIALTGTPLQNNLIEYHCMVSFVKPNLLGTRREFSNRFINPIVNGQCSDSTPFDVKLMKRRAHILHDLLAGCVQRKDYSVLTQFLPPKFEYVISVRLSLIQIELYQKYLDQFSHGDSETKTRPLGLFADYQCLMRIWSHPWVLRLDEIRQENKKKYDSEESIESFINDTEDEDSFSSGETEGTTTKLSESEVRSTCRRQTRSQKQRSEDDSHKEVVKEWKTKSRGGGVETEESLPEGKQEEVVPISNEWWASYIKEEDAYNIELSGKLSILFEILTMCDKIGDKVLIFSQSLLSLDLIEDFLEYIDKTANEKAQQKEQQGSETDDGEKTEDEENYGKCWTKGADYFRLDGSTAPHFRKRWSEVFNDSENYRARLFLISTKAGCLGINLVAANRVIIFDASWNPSHDIQSIFRVYRFGQTKPVYVYRLLAQGTMEEKIYERQVTKQSLSQRVIDEHQIERHFTQADLQELYIFKPDRLDDQNRPERPTPVLPKDRLLAELIQKKKDWIVIYHEHDSLLENKVGEELTEEERKAAWEEYENEKKGISSRGIPPQFQGMNPMHGIHMGQPYGIQYTGQMPPQLMQQLQQRSQIVNLRTPDIHSIVQQVKGIYPDLPADQFQAKVQGVMRQEINQQIAMQQRQIQGQLKREMERNRQMKLQIQRQFEHLQNQQRFANNPLMQPNHSLMYNALRSTNPGNSGSQPNMPQPGNSSQSGQ